MPDAYAHRRSYWGLLGRSAVVGALAAGSTVAFLVAEELLHELLWPASTAASGWFDTPVGALGVVMVAAVLVGLLRRLTGTAAPDPNFVDEMLAGRTDPRHALGLAGIGLVSLVGGASVGPEAPTATLGAGLGTAVSERGGRRSSEETADLAFAGTAGVFGGLLTFPFAAPVVALELQRPHRFDSYARLLPGLVAAVAALGVLFPLIGTPFLRLYDLGPAPLRSWHLLAAVPLGLAGAAVGVAGAVALDVVGRLAARIPGRVAPAVVAGSVVAAVGFAVPLTLFSGRSELETVLLEGVSGLGVGLLVATVAGKLVTFACSMRMGYYGGAIFPLLFVGSVTGVLLLEVLPGIPPAVVVTSLAGATTVAVVPLPLAVLVLVSLLFGLTIESSAVPAVAVVTGHLVVHGTGLLHALRRRSAPPHDPDP